MSFFTSFCDLLQKEQHKLPFDSSRLLSTIYPRKRPTGTGVSVELPSNCKTSDACPQAVVGTNARRREALARAAAQCAKKLRPRARISRPGNQEWLTWPSFLARKFRRSGRIPWPERRSCKNLARYRGRCLRDFCPLTVARCR